MALEVLQHRNYLQVAEGNLEFIRGDIWDVDFENMWPLAVYNPGFDLIKKRLYKVSVNMNNGVQQISKEFFDQEIGQNAGRDRQTGTTTLNFHDKEDQAITFMINDWLNQIADPETGFGRHKKELIFPHQTINIYNTLLQKIRYYEMWAGRMSNCNIPDDPGDKPTDLSDCDITLSWELMKRRII